MLASEWHHRHSELVWLSRLDPWAGMPHGHQHAMRSSVTCCVQFSIFREMIDKHTSRSGRRSLREGACTALYRQAQNKQLLLTCISLVSWTGCNSDDKSTSEQLQWNSCNSNTVKSNLEIIQAFFLAWKCSLSDNGNIFPKFEFANLSQKLSEENQACWTVLAFPQIHAFLAACTMQN